jgi:hypothetical protein
VNRLRLSKPIAVLALLLLVGGLAVEIHIRGKEAQARASLGGALGTATLPDTAGEQAQEMFKEARALAGRGDHAASATLLDRIATQAPHSSVHALAARVHRAAGHGDQATRHALIAARLSPDDPVVVARAENALDLALFDRVRPYAWTAIGVSLVIAAAFLGLSSRRAAREKEVQSFVAGLSGRICLAIDGQTCQDHAVLTTADRSLSIDVVTSGRYGMARPHAPARGPDLKITCSNAAANRTLRLTPVRGMEGSAVRIQVKDDTLARLRAHPGHWRVQAELGDRRLAVADLMVPEPMHALERRAAALTA